MHPFSDEDASIETLSHCSSFSDTASVADEGMFLCAHICLCIACYWATYRVKPPVVLFFLNSRTSEKLWNVLQSILSKCLHPVTVPGVEASDDTAQEDFQYKLKGFIDSTVDKR